MPWQIGGEDIKKSLGSEFNCEIDEEDKLLVNGGVCDQCYSIQIKKVIFSYRKTY
ncbi:hypothetical protein EV146_11397 [Mesobacillus foraminis]|uniref:Uncharacterized protein n=2 Tax=Mesobacillus foraminis TaxID=279826 RepID=A0A4R2B4J7_9BACI|nr:hypothetical protein EV146_11397 [Mesobacillus foraminis]